MKNKYNMTSTLEETYSFMNNVSTGNISVNDMLKLKG